MPAETTYELTDARVETNYAAWAVYKDFDGMAPDGDEIVPCASEELAKLLASWLDDHDPKGDDEADGGPEELLDFEWPHADGYEHAASWQVCPVRATADKIATSWSDVLAKITLS